MCFIFNIKPNKKWLLAISVPIIFILAVAVWYSPIIFKGYSAPTLTSQIILARNLNQTNIYGLENQYNVILSSDLVVEQAQQSTVGNKLTALCYAQIFKITGPLTINQLILISAVINALALLFFMLCAYLLFGWQISFFFALIYIFLPFNWRQPYHLGTYEFTLLFLSIFFYFYFLSQKNKSKKIQVVNWLIAGSFLGLACLAREAIFVLLPCLLIYFLFKKSGKWEY